MVGGTEHNAGGGGRGRRDSWMRQGEPGSEGISLAECRKTNLEARAAEGRARRDAGDLAQAIDELQGEPDEPAFDADEKTSGEATGR